VVREALCWILIIAIVWSGQVWASGPASVQTVPAAPTEPGRTDDLRSEIDRSKFELAALGDSLDWDPAAIIRFVREEIAFEQYEGLLRGAPGTLMSRAGNSLDQAVLLGTLLKDAGLDARILRGRLSQDQARTLLRLMRAPSESRRLESADSPSAAGARTHEALRATEFDHLFSGMDTTFGPEWDLPSSESVGEAVEGIVGILRDGRVELGDPEALARLEGEAQDYFWIEYRSGPSEGWKSEQPVFREDEGGFSNLESIETLVDEIPPELQHRVRIQAFVEQKFGNDLRVYPVMDPWEMPAANLMGRVLSLVNYPSGLSEETRDAGWDAIVEKTDLILPMLNGSLAPGSRGFNLDGTIYSLDAMGMDRLNAKALFETLGTKLEKAVGALGSLGADDPSEAEPVALTAQWIDYTFIAPGGEETLQRRMVLDRLGPDARARVDFSSLDAPSDFRELVAVQTFVVNGGQLANEYLKDQYLASREAVLEHNRGASGFEGVLLLYKLFEEDPGRQTELITYRPAPNLVVRGIVPDSEDKDRFLFYTDVVSNARRSLRWTPELPIPDPVANVRQGIWESFTERLAIAGSVYQVPGDLRRMEASWGRASSDRVLLRQDRSQALAAVSLPDDLKAQISVDLADGFAVIASPHASESPDHRSWWRVDAGTGVTLGMGPSGRGESLMGYVILLGLVASGITGAIAFLAQYPVDVYECAKDPGQGGSIAQVDQGNHQQTQCRCERIREHRRMQAPVAAFGFCKAYHDLREATCQRLSQCYTDGSGNAPDKWLTDSNNYHNYMTKCQLGPVGSSSYRQACGGS
jgi:hypothetical protein